MAGHSKWSKVKHIKGVVDVKRGQLFSKLSREISIAAREGGKDPDLNPRLRQAIAASKAQNMPNENIERAIKKGAGELEGVAYEEICYEGYAPGGLGIAMIVETATDNKNRTAAEIRRVFTKHHGNLGSTGSVTYLFDRKGEIQVPREEAGEEKMLEIAMEAGAEDVSTEDDAHILLTAHQDLAAVADRVRAAGLTVTSQRLVYTAQNPIPIDDPSIASQVLRLYDSLDDQDDTTHVFSNFDISDEVLAQIDRE